MLKPIKYRRFDIIVDTVELQEFLDKLIADGFEIIYYNEKQVFNDGMNKINVVALVCKKQIVI